MSIEELINKYYHSKSASQGTDSAGSSSSSSRSNQYDAYETYSIFHEETNEKSKLIDEETFLKIQNGEEKTDDELVLSVINAAQSDDDKEKISYQELEELCDYFSKEATEKIQSSIEIDDKYKQHINKLTEQYVGKDIKDCSKEEINKAITNKIIDKIAKKANAFSNNSGYQLIKGDGDTNMSYSVITPNNIDTNKEAPVIVYLHGGGGSERSLYNQIFNNYDLEKGFNGYIICPTANSKDWDNANAAKDIDEILNVFSQTHKIDTNNIVIAGHSMGGTGALYMSNSATFNDNEGFKFSKVAALTGYPDSKKYKKDEEIIAQYDIPTAIWLDNTSKNILDKEVKPYLDINGKDQYVDLVGKAHTQIDNIAFTQDSDNDGKADLIEWLFDDS